MAANFRLRAPELRKHSNPHQPWPTSKRLCGLWHFVSVEVRSEWGWALLEFSHNGWLVAVSLIVALMAGFSGLSLTQGASALDLAKRKLVVVVAAVVLGGGIWSMHFVAMLGLQLPILYYYDALMTLISALVAILMVGLAFLILHFRPRTPATITLAGGVVGLGIAVMHFVGMMGMELCRPVFSMLDIGISVVASLGLSVLAIWVAYGARTHRNILLGTVCFGGAVFAVHFIAMSRTGFLKLDVADAAGPVISNETLAMGVALAAFAISGAFLLTGISFLGEPVGAEDTTQSPDATPAEQNNLPVPYEKDGRTQFAEQATIAAVRAEGHYSVLYVKGDKLFCPWSISEAASRLGKTHFVRAHRSYLINPAHVTEFRRTKDTAICLFAGINSLPKVPVSRSRLGGVRKALGI